MGERFRDTFLGVKKGPEVITALREHVANKPVADVHGAIQLVLDQHEYSLSPRQTKIFDATVDTFIRSKRAAAMAKTMFGQDPESFRQTIANQLHCTPEAIGTMSFHPISLTIVVDEPTFKRLWDHQVELQGTEISTYPGGFTDRSMVLSFDDEQLPYSLIRKNDNAQFDDHENLHIEDLYLRPQPPVQTEITSFIEVRKSLRERATATIENSDQEGFRTIIREITHAQLTSFLAERCSYTVNINDSAMDRFFGDEIPLYTQDFIKNVDAVREAFPVAAEAQLPWEKIIAEELVSLRHKAEYIEKRYFELKDTDIPLELLVAVQEFLTPEQGYLISAYLEEEPITVSKVRAWKREYERFDTEKGRDATEVWVRFLLDAASVGESEYDSVDQKAKKWWQVKKDQKDEQKTLIGEDQEFNFQTNVETIVRDLQEIVQRRISNVHNITNAAMPLLWHLPMDRIDEITTTVLMESIDFHEVFSRYVEDQLRPKAFQERRPMVTRDDERYIQERSHILDSAAEELLELLVAGEEPDYNLLFQPEFQKPDWKYERLKECIDRKGAITTNGDSPFDDEMLAILQRAYVSYESYSPRRGRRKDSPEKQFKILSSVIERLFKWAQKSNYPDSSLIDINTYRILSNFMGATAQRQSDITLMRNMFQQGFQTQVFGGAIDREQIKQLQPLEN